MSEASEQAAIIDWFRTEYPQFAKSLRVSQSGGYKGKGRQGAIRMAQIKAQGGVTGEADIAILLPRGGYGSMLVEYKASDGRHKETPAQIGYINYHNDIAGNCAVIAKGTEIAIAAIRHYMGLPKA